MPTVRTAAASTPVSARVSPEPDWAATVTVNTA